MPAVTVHRLSKHYGKRAAIDDVSLEIEQGEMVALIGSSGSGKSTLLRHIAGLTAGDPGPGRGTVDVHGHRVQQGGALAADIRRIRSNIGFIFQQYNLVGRLPVLTNVLAGRLQSIPAWRAALKAFTRDELAAGLEALVRVGLGEQALQRASTLSGGQQQRAAIARTLVQRAPVILADEPIASLDPQSSRRVMNLLSRINREDRTTVLVSLHQVEIALGYCARTVALSHGRIVYDGESSALTPAMLRELYGDDAAGFLDEDATPVAGIGRAVPSPVPVA